MKCVFITLCGEPNAGKSTLLNQLVGQKISIVSPKVQTTRTRIRGIVSKGDTQIVFIDTPGIFSPKRKLEKAIVQDAFDGLGDGEVIALLVDCKKGLNENVEKIIEQIKQLKTKTVLILNKVDLIKPEQLLPLSQKLNEKHDFVKTFMVSAKKRKGLEELTEYFASIAPDSPWMYPDDQNTDTPFSFFIAEITREQLFYKLEKELPYTTAVETENIETTKRGDLKVNQIIYVATKGQKQIILGKNGAMIKAIGQKARGDLERITGQKIHLFLHVKVKENWLDQPENFITP